MALVKCRECGKEVAKSANACPSCGVGHPAGKPTGCVSYVALAVLAVFLFKVCSSVSDLKKTGTYEGPIEMINGCCFKCLNFVKHNANDPGSIECVGSTRPVQEGETWTTTTTFRGKNAFGAKVISTKKFYLKENEVVDVK